VSIDGRDPHRLAPAERQHLLTFLPASRDIAWPLSASDLIRLGLPRPDDARVGELLATFDLEAMQSRRVDRLSTGERSRVLIARALAARPRLLLLDEPASNLDPLWQLKLMAGLAADVRGSEAAGLIAIHDLDLGARFADRLIVMDRGRIAADGPPASIMDSAVIAQVFGIERRDGRWHPAA
jgi:iron complex transport system ATP-binding protein